MTRAIAAFVLLAACTPGGTSTPPGGSGATTTIDVNLTDHAAASTQAGQGGGYAPLVTNVHVGDTIRFVNSDSFPHTATAIPNATSFPSNSPFSASAQTQSGTMISQSWSTGVLAAGASSQTILVDKPGTYLYGCFFHYGAPMRAEAIVAQ